MKKTRTYQYLWPALCLTQGAGFARIAKELRKSDNLINLFIGDVDFRGEPPQDAVYLLVKRTQSFEELTKYMSEYPIYITDYEVDVNLHMFVLHVEDTRAFSRFMESKYSRMYTKEFLASSDFKQSDGTYIDAYHVLAKTEEYQTKIRDFLMLADDFVLNELDEVIDLNDEIFNRQRYNDGHWT